MIVLLSIYILVIGGFLSYVIGARYGSKAGYISAGTIFLVYILLNQMYIASGNSYTETLTWAEIPGFISLDLTFKVDGIAYAFITIILIVTMLSAVYSVGYMDHAENVKVYFLAYMLYTAAMIGAVASFNLLQFFFFWEAMLIPSYFMIAEWGYGDRRRVAFKYFLYTQLGSVLLIVAIGILGIYSLNRFGTINFDVNVLYTLIGSIPNDIQRILLVLMLIGFGVKMAIVPLHGWLPEAHAEAPTPISVILSGVMIEIGLYGLIRYTLPFTQGLWSAEGVITLLLILALITLFYGGLMAIVQKDVKRLLAYSSISQMGYMFLGLAAANIVSLQGSIMHVFSHGLLKALLFMVAGVLIHVVGIRDLDSLGGLASKMPITAVTAVVGAMGIAGLPGIAAFISEFLIFGGIYNASLPNRILFTVLAVLGTAVSAAYMTIFIRKIFFGRPSDKIGEIHEVPTSMLIPMVALAILAILIGIYPAPVLNPILDGLSEYFNLFRGV